MAKDQPPPRDEKSGKFVSSKTVSMVPEGQLPEQMREREKPKPKEEPPPDMEGLRKMASVMGIDFTDEEAGIKKKEEPKEQIKPKAKPAAKPAETPREEPQKLNMDELPKKIAEAVATAIKQPDDKPAEKPQVTEEEELTLSVLKEMETRWPKKYPGLAARYAETQKALVDYAKKWVTDHPGQEFDEDAPEHDDFYKQHEVDWDDNHFNATLARMEARAEHNEIEKKIKGELGKELEDLKTKDRLRDSLQAIHQEQTTAAKLFWGKFNGEYAGIMKEDGNLDLDKVSELKQSDGDNLTLRAQIARSLDEEVAELYKLLGNPEEPEFKPFAQFNPTNPVHGRVDEFAARTQKELAAAPKEERLDDQGRDFMPFIEYWKLPKDKRSGYWTFTARDLALLRAAELASKTQKIIDDQEAKFNAKAKQRGLIKDEATADSRTEKKVEPKEEVDDDDGKPRSPSSSPSSRMAAAREKGGNHPKSGVDRFIEEAISGR